MQGYTANLFKVERSPWSDLTGEIALEKKDVKLLGKDWEWEGDWKVQGRDVLRQKTSDNQVVFIDNPQTGKGMSMDIDGTYDSQGWQYSVDFKGQFVGRNEPGKYVRRRTWVRI